MLILHDNTESGNAYKIRLLLSFLQIEFKTIQYDVVNGETRTKDFLTNINKNGRIPVLQFEDGRYLAESNAILYYISQNTNFFPDDPWQQAKVMEWMFFEQYSHEPFVAVAKFILTMLPETSPRRSEIPTLHEKGYAALKIMEDCLENNDYLVGSRLSIADIALYAYSHKAHLGNFDMTRFPAINKWFKRIEAEPNYLTMYPNDWESK
ncbi:MAG: glutathione S-transferase family protein [Kordiimonadaceae bacterium]|nr:glutathione S-transferase family protein [Kordiimonadaceae bacterium]